jgi:hypothetical protein
MRVVPTSAICTVMRVVERVLSTKALAMPFVCLPRFSTYGSDEGLVRAEVSRP